MSIIFTNINGKEAQLTTTDYAFTSKRTIYLTGEVNDKMAESIVADIMHLSYESKAPITILINSPGGSVTAGYAIHDAMKLSGCPINTVVTGAAYSMGAFLLAAGSKGRRYALPNAEIMIHQPLGGASGQASEISIVCKHILDIRRKLNEALADFTGQPLPIIEADTERDNYKSAEEALEYGLIDHIASNLEF